MTKLLIILALVMCWCEGCEDNIVPALVISEDMVIINDQSYRRSKSCDNYAEITFRQYMHGIATDSDEVNIIPLGEEFFSMAYKVGDSLMYAIHVRQHPCSH